MGNPKKHNLQIHGSSVCKKKYDNNRPGMYFITICCQYRICRFGNIDVIEPHGNAQMKLNEFGTIAYNEWVILPERFPHLKLDVFQIMPDHMHAIIKLTDPIGARFTRAHTTAVGTIVGAYKSLVTNKCLQIYKSKYIRYGTALNQIPQMGKIWQRKYYAQFIHNNHSYKRISNYIQNNPANWK